MTLLTEEEAKGKWCPFARVDAYPRGLHSAGVNRAHELSSDFSLVNDKCRCIASSCMAWRWQPAGSVDNPSHIPGRGQSVKRETGYCGLVGGPT